MDFAGVLLRSGFERVQLPVRCVSMQRRQVTRAVARSAYMTSRKIWTAEIATMPSIRWHITFVLPRTRTVSPP